LVVSATEVVAMVAAGGSDRVVFVLDTGCSQHIFNGRRESMINFIHKIQRISTANDKGGLSSLGVGDLPIVLQDDTETDQRIVLKEVLWAPNATASMLSISQSVANGCQQGADDDGAWLLLPPPVSAYILADSQGGLYLIKAVLQIVAAEVISLTTHSKTDTSVELASANIELLALQVHAALGHINWTAVKQRLSQGGDGQVGGLPTGLVDRLLSLKTLFCAACDVSKKTQRSLPKFIERQPQWLWELVEVDHCGPFQVQHGGFTHITLAIELTSRVGFILERRSLNANESTNFLAEIDNISRRSSNGIQTLRTDEGGDWKSRKVAEFVADRGIVHQFATVNAHGQNGVVERRFRYYQECGIAMLKHCGAPFSLLFKAIKMLNFIENNVIRTTSSRFNTLFETQSTVEFFPFGSKVTAFAPRQKQAGFGRDKNYALVGYSTNHKGGYELFDMVTERCVVRRDVNCLTFYANTSAWKAKQLTSDNQDDDGGELVMNSDSASVRRSVKHGQRAGASPTLSLSLSLSNTQPTGLKRRWSKPRLSHH